MLVVKDIDAEQVYLFEYFLQYSRVKGKDPNNIQDKWDTDFTIGTGTKFTK